MQEVLRYLVLQNGLEVEALICAVSVTTVSSSS